MKKIPRIFHFVFGLRPQTEPFHLIHYLCIASCMGINKPDAVMFHCQHMPWGHWWDRIAPYLQLRKIEPDKFISSFSYNDPAIGKYRHAHLSDIARLEILIKYGGIYADIDTLFINDLPDRFFEYEFVMGMEKVDWMAAAAKDARGSLCNAWMMGMPDSDFARLLLVRTYESFDGTWSAHSTFLPYRLSCEHPDWIHVEPQRSFFFYDWTGDGIRGIFEKTKPNLDNVYSIHLWSHLWWDRNRTDTSYFHAGRLTPEYVKFSRSAYAELARPFLPKDVSYNLLQFELQKTNAFLENGALAGKKYLGKIHRQSKNTLRKFGIREKSGK
ncbi:MAG: glycosyl transferase [Smithella sp. SDB]|nr:MAG: glycosyl transferase [Smithella sp. SDB]